MKQKYYSVHPFNEYNYNCVGFSIHTSLANAEKKAYHHFVQGEMGVSQDKEGFVFQSKEEFIEWCEESYFIIDWKAKLLRFDKKRWERGD